jgi:hypothetical protein
MYKSFKKKLFLYILSLYYKKEEEAFVLKKKRKRKEGKNIYILAFYKNTCSSIKI